MRTMMGSLTAKRGTMLMHLPRLQNAINVSPLGGTVP